MWACHEPHLFQGWRGGSNLLARDLLAVLAWEPCHCEPCRIHGVAISLPVLHLPAKLVTLDGVKRQKQSLCKQHLFFWDYFATLVMTKAKIATLRSRWQVVCTLAHGSCPRTLSLRTLKEWSNLFAIPVTSSVNILLQNFMITIHLLKRLYK